VLTSELAAWEATISVDDEIVRDRREALRRSLAAKSLDVMDLVYTAEDLKNRVAPADAANWIRSHGSARLRRILDEGYLGTSDAVYRDERLRQAPQDWKPYAVTHYGPLHKESGHHSAE